MGFKIRLSGKKREKKEGSVKTVDQEPRACLNCGHMDTGKFCSNCGQSFAGVDKPMRDVLHDLLEIFNLDRSIVQTIVPFLFKPGFLSSEYIAGRRKKYLSPVKFYLFMSIVFFFLARDASKISNENLGVMSYTLGPDSNQTVIRDDSTIIEILSSDSLYYSMASPVDSTDETALAESEKFRQNALDVLTHKQLLLDNFFRYLSYSLFLLMPIFALLLQLLYIRRNRYYIEHIVFTINMHSFALFILSLMLLIGLFIKGDDNFLGLLLLLIPVYFTIGMKRFYKQNIFKTLLKEFILGFIYTLLLIGFMIGSAILAYSTVQAG